MDAPPFSLEGDLMGELFGRFAALCIVAVLSSGALAQSVPLQPQRYTLKAAPNTVAWGYYDAAAAPVLRIHSGDTVVFETLITNSPTGLENAGVAPEQVQQSLRDIYRQVTNKGPGGHILNGPVYIEEAEPGDTLEVHIQQIELAIPYAYNAFGPTRGFLPEDFPYRKMKIIPLNRER
jgi:acetamidase/formamidase